MLKREMNIADYDAELWQAMEQEKVRQEEHIELIASENYTSPRVMQAQGSQLTNKYAEGYPGKRYYGGCEVVDQSEQTRYRPPERNLRCRMGKRTTAFRSTSQCSRISGCFESGRQVYGIKPRTRRTPFSRFISKHFRHYLHSLRIQSESGNRPCRLRPDGRSCFARKAENDYRRRLCLFPRMGLQTYA